MSVVFAQLPDRTLAIGSDTTYPPMEAIDPETGKAVGFDVDLMHLLFERPSCVTEFVTTAWDGEFVELSQAQFDMVVSGV
jgi:polar amino acid transport system substrate-binding protein